MDRGRGGVEIEDLAVGAGEVADRGAGLEYGVEGMRVGGRRRIRVPPHLAYGKAGVPDRMPANAQLEFHVELLSSTPAIGE